MNVHANANPLFRHYRDQHGVTLEAASFAGPVMLVLLRHIGCSFCRETLHELAESRKHIEECGYAIGLVHMDAPEYLEEQLAMYGLGDVSRFHDPDRALYRALGLGRVPLSSALNKRVWQKGLQAHKEFGGAWPKTDPLQLPGAFVIDQGRVVAGEAVLSPEEHPDFLALLIRIEAVAASA